VVIPEAGAEQDPARWLDLVAEHRITLWNTVPARLAMLVEEAERAERAPDTLRLVLSGGDRLPVELPARVWKTFGPDVQVINLGGATEASIHSTIIRIEEEHLSRLALPYGRPMAGQTLYVVDGYGCLVPPGVVGELWIGGVGLARGYAGRAGLTAERFTADPFGAAGGRVYRTGDLARWRSDGSVELVGRADHQVKVRGFRIELGEIEFVLGRCPGVERAVVVVREDSLVGFVVAGEGEVEAAGLRAFCAERLPGYLVPQLFVVVRELPLTPNGKVDRRALGVVAVRRPAAGSTVAPRTATEEVVAAVFAGVLGLERTGALDDFFELGGHSLLATQVVSRLRDLFDVAIPLRTLFENPTVAGLSQAVDRGPRAVRSPIARVDATAGVPLSLQQRSLWHSAQNLGEAFRSYNIPLELRLHGELDIGALERSLVDLIADHDILRTTFPERDGAPVQVVAESLDFTLETVSATREQVDELARAQALQPFSLTTAPPWRCRLLALDDGDHVLLLTLHHVLGDGWSMDTLARQLGVRYEAHAAGLTPAPQHLPAQYADYAVWQDEWMRGAEAQQQKAYWAEHLRDLRPLWDRRIDEAHPELCRGVRHRFSLPASTAEALRTCARENNATLYMVTLTGLMLLLAEFSGQDDIAVGTPVAGRTRPELEKLVGYFAHILLLRADLPRRLSFGEALARVREQVLSAFANQDVSVSSVMSAPGPGRYRGRVSHFQAHFSLLHEAVQKASFGELDVSVDFTRVPNPLANIDLELEVFDRGGSIDAWMIYNEGMFQEAEIAALVARLLAIYERANAS
jgi:acyl carrier protein